MIKMVSHSGWYEERSDVFLVIFNYKGQRNKERTANFNVWKID